MSEAMVSCWPSLFFQKTTEKMCRDTLLECAYLTSMTSIKNMFGHCNSWTKIPPKQIFFQEKKLKPLRNPSLPLWKCMPCQMSHEKKPPTFHWILARLKGILIMGLSKSPYDLCSIIPYQKPNQVTNQGMTFVARCGRLGSELASP